jgi:hypothetical protein
MILDKQNHESNMKEHKHDKHHNNVTKFEFLFFLGVLLNTYY